jgi:cytochrome c oxidase subunit 2
MQVIALIVTLVLMAAVILLFWFVVYNSSKKREDYEPIVKKWYRIRSIFGLTLIAFLIIMTFVTLKQHLPFDEPVYGAGIEPVVVDAQALQFGFNLSKTEFKAGEPIEFDVTSADVNHGFGLYDENNQVLAQTQAMPGYTNKLYYTFEKPGTYKILCIEYCGLGHHLMMSKITVK